MRKQRENKNEEAATFAYLAKAWDTSYTSVCNLEKIALAKLKPAFEIEDADRLDVCQIFAEMLQERAAFKKAIIEVIVEEYNLSLPKATNFTEALRELRIARQQKEKFEQLELL